MVCSRLPSSPDKINIRLILALRLAATKLPVLTDFISRSAGPKLGALELPAVPPKPITGISSKIIRKPLQPLSVIDQESLKVPAGDVAV